MRVCLLDSHTRFAEIVGTISGQLSIPASVQIFSSFSELRPYTGDYDVVLLNLDMPNDMSSAFGVLELALIYCPSHIGLIAYGFAEVVESTSDPYSHLLRELGIPYIRLPCVFQEFEGAFAKCRESMVMAQVARRRIRSQLAGRWTDEADRRQRHAFGNCRAAVRLLHGALRSGDFSLSTAPERGRFERAYLEVARQDRRYQGSRIDPLSGFDLEVVAAALPEASDSSANSPPSPLDRITRVLVVDDEASIWRPVFAFILGEHRVTSAQGAAEALTFLTQAYGNSGDTEDTTGPQGVDVVFLDIDLGEGEQTGLELLHMIKDRYLDLPVIMFTAYDDAHLVKECLERGAYTYFAKELAESKDRDSIAYYRKLKELLEETPGWDDDVRRILRRFSNAEGYWRRVDYPYGTCITRSLQRALYYLTAEPIEVVASQLLDGTLGEDTAGLGHLNTDLSNLVVFYCGRAMDEMSIAKLISGGMVRDQAQAKLEQLVGGRRPTLFEKVTRAFPPAGFKNTVMRRLTILSDLVGRARHGKHPRAGVGLSHAHLPALPDSSVSAAEAAVTILEAATVQTTPYLASQTSKGFREIPALPNRARLMVHAPHHDISAGAARKLHQGFQLLEGAGGTLRDPRPGSPPSVRKLSYRAILIDDEAGRTPWEAVLTRVMEHHGWSLEVVKDWDPARHPKDFDAIILDFVRDEQWEVGLSLLETIKSADLSVPVVILTVENSSRPVRKALQAGAYEYFVKEPEGWGLTADAYYTEFSRLIARLSRMGRAAPMRKIWYAITHLEQKRFGLSNDTLQKLWQQRYRSLGVARKDVEDIVRRALTGYVKSAYFSFLLSSDAGITIDRFRVERLLWGGSISARAFEEIALNCGKAVELLVHDLTIAQAGTMSHEDTGMLLWQSVAPLRTKVLWDHLWWLRNRAKTGTITLSNTEVGEVLLETVTAVDRFRYWTRAHAGSIEQEDDVYINSLRAQFGKGRVGTIAGTAGTEWMRVQFDDPRWLWGWVQKQAGMRIGLRSNFRLARVDPSRGIYLQLSGPRRF